MVETDTSNYTIEAVLYQKNKRKLYSIACKAWKINVHEINYDIYNKEILTIVFAFRNSEDIAKTKYILSWSFWITRILNTLIKSTHL